MCIMTLIVALDVSWQLVMFDSMQQQNKSFVIFFFRNDLLKCALLVSEMKPIVKYLTATLSEKQVRNFHWAGKNILERFTEGDVNPKTVDNVKTM